MAYSYSNDSSIAKSALKKISFYWWWHTICYLGFVGLLIGILYYGAITDTLFSNKTDPFIHSPLSGFILGVFLVLASLPTYSKMIHRKFSLHPHFESNGSSIVWSDERKTKSGNLFLFVIRAIVYLPLCVIVAPLVPIAVCPYKAKEISNRFGVKSFNYKLAITVIWILIVAAFVGGVILLISKKGGIPVGTNL